MCTASPVPLYPPFNTLKPVAENLWIADGGLIRMAMGIVSIPFSTRMTVVRLADGSLWLHSPIAPNDGLCAELEALGKIRHLVSPNYLHYAHIATWQARYPKAIAWASPGVRERAAAQGIVVHFDADLGDDAPTVWREDISQHIFQGSRIMREVVFFHHASRTLILTDLIENLETARMGWLWKGITMLAGNGDPDGKAPIDMRLTFRDRVAARQSFAHLLAWQPEKILLAHGRCYLENGTEELVRAFRWVDKNDKFS